MERPPNSVEEAVESVKVNRVYKNCLIVIQDREFSADLITLPFQEFDLIL